MHLVEAAVQLPVDRSGVGRKRRLLRRALHLRPKIEPVALRRAQQLAQGRRGVLRRGGRAAGHHVVHRLQEASGGSDREPGLQPVSLALSDRMTAM